MPPGEGRVYRAVAGRLDTVVVTLSGAARADVQRAIARGSILVDGVPRPKSQRLRGGERLDVLLGSSPEPLPEPGVEIPVRYRDDHVVVIVKPAGIITHPTVSRPAGTLVSRLLEMGIPLAPAGGPLRPGIVHRLDAGTSGLMVVASSDEAFEVLRGMFSRHEPDRRYLALVRGSPSHDVFTVEAPLGRRGERVVVDRVEGRPAATIVTVAERLGGVSLVEAAPETGRTHQIRVHLAAVGHPVIGDRRYGGAGEEGRRLGLRRPFLHSATLRFRHPVTDEEVSMTEPLPPDLGDAASIARADLRS